jgi:site-specific recombinase XerD
MPNLLRHTFVSHFIVLALQKILGHSSLNVTMRYLHLASNYLNQAVPVQFNPLSNAAYSCGKVTRKRKG